MNKKYPIDVLTYLKEDKLPDEVAISIERSKELGFYSLPITPDTYTIKPYHCGFKHLKEITIPKIDKIIDDIEGFFIAEGDLYIYYHFTFDKFLEMNLTKPTWLGYKKILSNYIVGNFLIYIPKTHYIEFKSKLLNQSRLIYSDRFFTKLVKSGWLKLNTKSLASEIEHYSNVINDIRKSNIKKLLKF
mgnify:CR=1 FL=1